MNFIKKICNWSRLKILVFLVAIAGFLMIFSYFMYFGVYLRRHLGDVGDWGSFGSYMGSITGLLAFAGVLYTVLEAKKETKAAKQESIKREERDLFFTMLKMYQRQADLITKDKSFFEFTKDEGLVMIVYIIYDSIVKDKNFKLSDDPKILLIQHKIAQSFGINADNLQISRDEIAKNLKERIESLFKEKDFSVPNVESFKDVKFNNELNVYALYVLRNITSTHSFSNYIFNIMKGIADMIYIENEDQLGQYFRTVYYILETISTNIEKEKYSKIFRSQLSKYELILLLFNMVSSQSTLETLKLYKDNDIFNNINSKDLMLYKFTKVKYKYNIDEFTNMLFNEYEKQQL